MKRVMFLGLAVIGCVFSFGATNTATAINVGGQIKCYCTSSGTECASNGATTAHCRTISDTGDCSKGANNCSANP